ncbi:hypothetical protein JCM8547_000809 [Rhodosporidiobolus lusitaniae]
MLRSTARAAVRALHSSSRPLRAKSSRSPASPSTAPSRYSATPRSTQTGKGRNGNQRQPPLASPSSISHSALVDKLHHHLTTVWLRSPSLSPPLRDLAADLGLQPPRLRSLADSFAQHAAASLPRPSPRNRRFPSPSSPSPSSSSSLDAHAPPSSPVSYDLDTLRTSFITDGPSSLFDSSLRAFLTYVRTHHPLPSPRFRSPNPDPTLHTLHQLAVLADRRTQALESYPSARQQRRRLILHVGPTNSGKTYSALLALSQARTGAYAGPLRLLAHEVFSRFNEGKIGPPGTPKRTCNLVTGEEQRILDPDAGLQSCTVEMFPLSRRLDVGVIDEIQMLGDPQRGNAWTASVVGSLCDELHLCGEESVVELVQKIAKETGDECVVKRYERLSPLKVAEKSLEGDLSRIRRGDCLVTFSRSNIFAFKRAVEQQTGLKVAVAYGGLPPEVREEQARAFNAGEYDVLVASDAVGMGLNLKIRRIVFESLHKWDGKNEVRLPTPQIKQIAGRAGRYGVHTPISPSAPDLDAPLPPSPSAPSPSPAAAEEDSPLGEATTLDAQDLPILREAMAQPTVQVTQASLSATPDDFRALSALLPPSTPMSRLFSLFRSITLTAPHYRSTGTESLAAVGDILTSVEPLSFSERFVFGSAPVNLRDAKVVEALREWAGSFARGEKVLVPRWAEEKGVFDTLERVERVVEERKELAASDALDSLSRRQAAVFTPTALQNLESYHRCLTLYLWLSYRLANIFCHQQEARELRQRVEKAIEAALEGIRFERVSRGKGAKRNKARAFTEAEMGEKREMSGLKEWLEQKSRA